MSAASPALGFLAVRKFEPLSLEPEDALIFYPSTGSVYVSHGREQPKISRVHADIGTLALAVNLGFLTRGEKDDFAQVAQPEEDAQSSFHTPTPKRQAVVTRRDKRPGRARRAIRAKTSTGVVLTLKRGAV